MYDQKMLEKARMLLKAANHTLRTRIVEHLLENGSLAAGEIHQELNIEQAFCSQHLKILRSSGILNTQRIGKNIYYSPNKECIQFIKEFTKSMSLFVK